MQPIKLYKSLSVPLYKGSVGFLRRGSSPIPPEPPAPVYLLTDSENNLLVDSENYQLTIQS